MRRTLFTLTLTLFSVLSAGAATSTVTAQTPDPGTTGPLAVTREEYNYGDTAFTPTGFPGAVELRASVHYPTGLAGGPYPFIVFLHGRHATCYPTPAPRCAGPVCGTSSRFRASRATTMPRSSSPATATSSSRSAPTASTPRTTT